jgi:quercetin dioxygenase-like cupin family protein
MPAGCTFSRWSDVPLEKVTEQLDRKLLTGERIMLAQVFLKQGCIVPKHQHENEQFTYIVSGALKFFLGEDGAETQVVGAGEVLHIPSMVWHRAEALEDTLDLDVFSPPRADWLNHTDSYFHAESGSR